MYLIRHSRSDFKLRFRGGKFRVKSKKQRRNLVKMLAVMEASAQSSNLNKGASPPRTEPPIQEFLSSGRTGRRNALPDILGQHAIVTSSDLPSKLQALTTKDTTCGDPQPSPSTSKS